MLDTTTRQTGLTRDAVEELSRRRAEPDWLKQIRLEAFAAYEATPLADMPTGNWRRANLKGLDLEHQVAVPTDVAGTAPTSEDELAGRLVQVDGATVLAELDPALAARGVRVLDLAAAILDEQLGPRVQAAFGQQVAPTTDKFTALHYAFLNAGAVVYVPRNVAIERPIELRYSFDQPGLAAFVHTLIIAGEGAEVAVLDVNTSPEQEGAPLASGVVEISAASRAQVRYVRLQDWAPGVWDFSAQRATLGSDAHLRTLNAALGARLSRSLVQVILQGNGAQADILGVVPGAGRQHADFQTLQDHFGNATRSDLYINTALDDQSSSNFTGLIRINPSAHQTESSQQQRNVLLSPKAKADSDPKLEILNNDVVRCTHGASVGPLDAEILFYLQSRGIPHHEALDLLLEGFFQTVLEKLEMPALQIKVWDAVQRKLRRHED